MNVISVSNSLFLTLSLFNVLFFSYNVLLIVEYLDSINDSYVDSFQSHLMVTSSIQKMWLSSRSCVRNVVMWKSKVLIVNLLTRKSLGHDGQVCLNRTLRENRIANEAISRKNENIVERIEKAALYL